MGTKGYLTQCEGQCGRTTRLSKPGKWECGRCSGSAEPKTPLLPAIPYPWGTSPLQEVLPTIAEYRRALDKLRVFLKP